MAPKKAASPAVSIASDGDTVMAKAVSSAGTAATSMADDSVNQLASSVEAMSMSHSDQSTSSPARSKSAEGATADTAAFTGTPQRKAESPAAAPASPHTPGASPVTSRLGDDHGAFVLCRPVKEAEDFDCRATLSLPACSGLPPLDLPCKVRALHDAPRRGAPRRGIWGCCGGGSP